MERKGPVLILNVLDFAGQNQYRPMHHCFLTRRAMYLVVFNLQQIIVYICQLRSQQSVPSDEMVANPFEQIRYWLHSIHAHTLPAVPGKEKEPLKNVCLVGTHRKPSSDSEIGEKQLQEINNLIKKELEGDDRCLSHLHFMGPKSDRIFAAVENSIEDRKSSGAKALQEEIKVASQKFPFLNEKYPVVWYRFNTELASLKESLKENKSSLVVTVELVLKIATQCGITDPAGQNLALEFYHETEKIVCLKFLPPLFISEEEHAELKELVLLDPKWLIDVMMNVVELNFRSTIQNKSINQLRKTGIASCYLLKEAWSEYLREPVEQSFRQMCLMLQAEALIHPIIFTPPSMAATTDGYLIPGKLPEEIEEEPVECSEWITFYFDFQRFLPREIYHRLVCLLLAVVQRKKSIDKPYLSKNMCQFSNIDDTHLCVTFQEERHRLKISVLTMATDPREPTDHIHTIHTQYLRKICTLSNLEGLRYVGGPLLKCERCGKINVVRYVNYFEKEDRPSESECPKCYKACDVNQLTKDQVIDESGGATDYSLYTTPQDESPSGSQSPSLAHDPQSEQEQEQPGDSVEQSATTTNADSEDTTQNDGVLSHDHSPPRGIIVETDWVDIYCYLNKLDEHQIQLLGGVLGLSMFKLEKMKKLPMDMVRAWLRQEDDVKDKSGPELTWNILVKALHKIGQAGVANEIQKDKCT